MRVILQLPNRPVFANCHSVGSACRSFVLIGGERIFFKLDYYDLTRACHSPEPADPEVTERVMTIMLASEY